MTFEEIADKAEDLRKQQLAMPQMVPGGMFYSKYAKMEVELRQIINDQTTLIRNLARNLTPADDEVVVIQSGDTK